MAFDKDMQGYDITEKTLFEVLMVHMDEGGAVVGPPVAVDWQVIYPHCGAHEVWIVSPESDLYDVRKPESEEAYQPLQLREKED